MIKGLMGLNNIHESIVKLVRLEKTDVNMEKPRPLLVCSANIAIKFRVLRQVRALKDDEFKSIIFHHDMTRAQRNHQK